MARQTIVTPTPRIWGMPIFVTVLSLAALVIGLLADGVADVAAWVGAGLPIALTLWFVVRAFRP